MKQSTKRFAVCIENTGNEASLILGKVYRVVPDALRHYDLPQLVKMIHPRPCVPAGDAHDILKGLGLATDALP